MIRTLLVGAVALDEMIYNERHGSTDSGVYDEGEVVYGENGNVITTSEMLLKTVPQSNIPKEEVYEENIELVYGKNGVVTEISESERLPKKLDDTPEASDIEEREEEVTENEDELDEDDESSVAYENSEDEIDGSEESDSDVNDDLENNAENEEELVVNEEIDAGANDGEVADKAKENEVAEENKVAVEQIEDEEEEGEIIEEVVSEDVKEKVDANEESSVDSKELIRSELQGLLEEEQTMVELTETVKTASVEDKLNDDTDITNHHHLNGHQAQNGLLGMDENGDVVLTDDDTPPQIQNGFHATEEETDTKEIVLEENIQESEEVAMETAVPVEEVVDVNETEEAPKLRRSTRERKPNRNVAKDAHLDLFKDMNLKSFAMEGHHHDICSVDMFQTFAVSGGRDTSLKVWDSFSKEELSSFGGHDGTITCVRFMTDQSFEKIPPVVTSCLDCSLRIWNMDEGKMTKSIYVYSPVICMDYLNGLIAIGLEGGKVEVYGIEGDQQFTVNAYEDAVTSVKFLDSERVACGSTNGVVKIYNITSVDEKEPIFTLNPENVKVFNKHEAGSKPYDSQTSSILNMSKVTCIETWNDLVLYGDSGYNIKVLDYQKGELTKVRNNLKEFCPTETLHIGSVQSKEFLFSVGSDVDNGDAYINIRSLPDLQYLGTIRDIETNSGSVTSFALQEIDQRIHFVTGGSQLRVWNQVTRRGRKRKGSPNGDLPYVPCKYICNFTDPRDSEPESDNETETETESKTESSPEQSTERIPAGSSNSWCNIL